MDPKRICRCFGTLPVCWYPNLAHMATPALRVMRLVDGQTSIGQESLIQRPYISISPPSDFGFHVLRVRSSKALTILLFQSP